MSTALPSELLDLGARCGQLLKANEQTVGVAEGAAGGLISAALLAAPGASAYYIGGTVIYTKKSLDAFLTGMTERPKRLRGASEPWALHLAKAAQLHMGASWGIGEGGAAGPSGNAYGDPSGHAWVAVSGPAEATRNVLTGQDDRSLNMVLFAVAALELLAEQVEASVA